MRKAPLRIAPRTWMALWVLMTAPGSVIAMPGGRTVQERPNAVTLRGTPLTLVGPELQVGDKAPDFRLMNTNLQPVTLKDFAGKVKVLSSVPSLDTDVCSRETQKFHQLATQMGDDVVVLTVSMDLPFAQKRWCGAHGVDRVITLSDYLDHSFGLSYGVRIKELGLLARVVFILDRQDVIRYVQRVPEVAQEPDYEDILRALQSVQGP